MRQRYMEPGVSHPIHPPKSRAGEKTVRVVILDDDAAPPHPTGFPKQLDGIIGVMKNIDEQNRVERAGREREVMAIELAGRDAGVAADQHIQSGKDQIGPKPHDLFGDASIAAPDIEHTRRRREEWCQPRRENSDPAVLDVPFVDLLDQAQRRCIPRILMKKLDSTVWNPSAVRVTPGMTQRIVLA